MSIKVTHTSHSIEPPMELTKLLENLKWTGALANSLGLDDLQKQAKDIFDKINNQWIEKAEAQAKAKSHTDWLGGGDTYYVSKNSWDDYTIREVVKSFDISKKQQFLKYTIDEVKRQLINLSY